MKNIDILRKIMANLANIPSEEKYLDALIEGGIVGKEGDKFYLGDTSLLFAHNMIGEMADFLIQHKKMPKKFRDRLMKRYSLIAEIAFDKIYKEFKNLLDHTTMAWDGPMVMVLFLAEPTRNPEVTLEVLCELFEGFYEMAPKKGQKVLH